MPQAIQMRKETLTLISIKTGEPIADIQAMHEHVTEFTQILDDKFYVIVDFTGPNGVYVPWSEMSERIFREQFRFVFEPENPNKFEPVVMI